MTPFKQARFANAYPGIAPNLLGSSLLQALERRYARYANEFMCVFSHEGQEGPESIAAVGSAFGIDSRIDSRAGTSQLQLRLLHDGRVEREVSYPLDVTHYHEHVFASMSSFLNDIKPWMLKEHGLDASTLLLGGWQCGVNPSVVGEPLVFTIPKVVCRISEQAFDFHYLIEPDTPEVDEALVSPLSLNGSFEPAAHPRIAHREEMPPCGQYIDALIDLIEELSAEKMDKVVIARAVRLDLDRDVSPVPMLRLVAAHRRHHYEYVFRWAGGDAWLGISPETLLRKQDGMVIVEPLAGTRKGSESAGKGARYRVELMSDRKEIEEHETAANMFLEDLSDVCVADSIEILESRGVLDLGYVQHLKSKIRGRVKPGKSLFDVVGSVYPPATIWGKPIALSGQRLQRYECIDRGFYAGGLGYFSLADDANFALAIRTARLSGRHLHVYAGSGIVSGSDPYREWLETSNKMAPCVANDFIVYSASHFENTKIQVD